ncbi:hypothetical protein M9Y10_029132 [Tritrichomonas musculus]|uniref:PDEase domain-containing protein n=1 Tax=Tritrichomonas musculus TaxID=1915356 RepID=A0ABR2KLB4_9EUKA
MFSHYGIDSRKGRDAIYTKNRLTNKNPKSKKAHMLISYSTNPNQELQPLSGLSKDTKYNTLSPNERVNRLFDKLITSIQIEPFASCLEKASQQLFNSLSATVWIMDYKNYQLLSPTKGILIDHNKGIIGTCFSQQKIISCQKPSDHPDFDVSVDSLTNSTLYIPILKSFNQNDDVFGIIAIYASSTGNDNSANNDSIISSFSEEDIQVAELFSKKLTQYSHFFTVKSFDNQIITDLSSPSEVSILDIEKKLCRAFNSRSIELWKTDIFNTSYMRYDTQNDQFVEIEGEPGVVSIALNRNHSANIQNVLHSPEYRAEIDGSQPEAVLMEPIKVNSNSYAIIVRRSNKSSKPVLSTDFKSTGPQINDSSFSFHEELLIKKLSPFISNILIDKFADNDDYGKDQIQIKGGTLFGQSANFAQRLKALLEVAEIISGVLDIEVLIGTIMERSCSLLNAERCSLFLVDLVKKELVTRFHGGLKKSIRLPIGRGIVGHTATTGNIVNITDAYSDPRFDKQVDLKTGFKTKTILTVPIYNNRGEIAGVTEVINKIDGGTFDEGDIKMMMAFNVFCGISLDNAKLYQSSLNLTRQLRGFVEMSSALNKTKNIHAVLEEILTSAKEVINASRATIFMCENESIGITMANSNSTTKLLPFVNLGSSIAHGTIFADDIVEMKQPKVFTKQEIFYKINEASGAAMDGLYGGESDNKKLNASTLSRATSFLISDDSQNQQNPLLSASNLNNDDFPFDYVCGIPMISSSQKVMGVMELCCTGKILNEDLKLLDCYAVFAAVSIERSELQEIANLGKIEVQMNQYLTQEERKTFEVPTKMQIEKEKLDGLFTIAFDAVAWDGIGHFKVLWAIADTFDLLKEFKIPNEKWFRFLLEISQTYKKVPYHNWRHAVDVTQFVTYQIKLTHLEERLTKFELLGFIVAAICHDANHDGFTNVFNEKAETPLGILYKNQSVMETHHCTVAITVISKEDCNIFSELDAEQNKNMWNLIIQLILITDMAKHFDFLKMVNGDIDKDGPYDESDAQNRLKIMQCILKCGDISNVSRPFELADKWCDVLCEEFFRQGDLELASGMEYTSPLNDREHLDKPKSQIGFYTFVCLPLYQTAARVYPALEANVNQVQSNLKIWKSHIEEKNDAEEKK